MSEDLLSQLAEARKAFDRRDAAVCERLYGQLLSQLPGEAPEYRECLERLIVVKRVQNKVPELVPLMVRLIRLGEDYLGGGHHDVNQWKHELIAVYLELGRTEDADFVRASLPGFIEQIREQQVDESLEESLLSAGSSVDELIVDEPAPAKLDDEPLDPKKFLRRQTGEQTLWQKLGLPGTGLHLRKRLNEHINELISGYSILAAFLVLLCFVYYTYAPTFEPEIKYQNTKPLTSAGQGSNIRFLSNKQVELISNNKSRQFSCFRFRDAFSVWASSFSSALLRREYWVLDKGTFLRDELGTTYFAESSPESTIIGIIKHVADSMQRYCLEKGHYPEELENMEEIRFSYLNPFTGRKDKPLLRLAILDDSKRNTAASMARKVLLELEQAGKFPFEPVLYPGCVDACLYQIKGTDAETKILAVHGCGEDGQLISTDGVRKTFLAASQNGVDIHFERPDSPLGRSFFGLGKNMQFRPAFMCLLSCDCGLPLEFLRYRGAALYLVLTGYFAFLWQAYKEDCRGRKMTGIFALTSLALVLGSLLNAFCP